jgi:hypothetical protein
MKANLVNGLKIRYGPSNYLIIKLIQKTTKYFRNETYGILTTYKCKFKQRKAYNCKSTLRVYRPQNSQIIRIDISAIDHNHEASLPLKDKLLLTEKTKQIIFDNHKEGKSPSRIRNILQDARSIFNFLECIVL